MDLEPEQRLSLSRKDKRRQASDTEGTNTCKRKMFISTAPSSPFSHVSSLDEENVAIVAYWNACAVPDGQMVEFAFKDETRKKLHAKHLLNPNVTYIGSEYKHPNLKYKLQDDSRSVKIYKMKPIIPEKESRVSLHEMDKGERSDVIRSKFSSKKVARNLAQSKKHSFNLSQSDAYRLKQKDAKNAVQDNRLGGRQKSRSLLHK